MLQALRNLMAGIAIGIMIPAAANAADAGLVFGEANWVGSRILTYILAEAVHERFPDVVINIVPASNAVMFEAMDRGKGDIDVHADIWLPNQESFTSKYVDERGTVKLSEGYYEGRGGYCIPTYLAQEQGIKSVFDLASPEKAALFDTDGDGKGEMWIGAPGWNSANRYLVQFRDYGLGAFFEPVQTAETIAYAQLGDAVRKHEPYVFACYSPHYVFDLYDLTFLTEPAYDADKYYIADPQDNDWFSKSYAKTGAEPRHAHVGYSATLDQRLPQVANFLANVNMDADTMTRLSSEIVQKGRDAREVAKEWVRENAARIDSWVEVK